MATTLASDLKFLDPFSQTGYIETITQDIAKFNAGSAGAITLKTERKHGDFDYKTLFPNVGGLVTRQDQTSKDAIVAKKLAQATIASVKLNRKIGSVEWAIAGLRKAGLNLDAIRVAAGEMAAKQVLADMLNSSLSAAAPALAAQAAVYHDGKAAVMSADALATGLSKFGDAASNVKALVMHSKVYFDLVKGQIAQGAHGSEIAGAVLRAGEAVSFNRPIIVTDSDALFDSANSEYLTLGLSAGAIEVEETEDTLLTVEGPITGFEQLVMRMQGEFAYNLGIKGFTWDVANGGKNPTATALATAANWGKVATSHKDLAGFVIRSK